ncbi:PTS cellobiose transporter subunit IIA [Oribacterium sp. C9]|uniref:PTS transporter subunit EIIC n=1 Tax=Oribacterium sp. C9 TaxID=1943579 RepID=UPI00098EA8C4|nr:PTS transporter subunit EIIC [Oribacterium sp. C9]OON86795.1 PTS cellobiose transporter subunit IIA [Oribacterium sp. C9]
MANYTELAEAIVAAVGGKENINTVIHCSTRLRFTLVDQDKADESEIKKIPGVLGCIKKIGQLQIIIGNHVNKVYPDVCTAAGIAAQAAVEDDADTKEDKKAASKVSLGNRLMDFMVSCFAPILAPLAGAGVLKGLLVMASTYSWISTETGFYTVMNAASDAIFYFLPMLLAYTAAKKLKADIGMAMVLAGILIYPTIIAGAGESSSFLGIPFTMVKYSGSVIPILMSVYVMNHVHKFFSKIVPDFLRIVVVPLLTLTVMAPVAIVVLGPIGYYIGIYVGEVIKALFNFSPLLAGLFVGGTRQFLVFAGMHFSMSPIMMNNFATLGYDMIAPVNCVATMAVAGMAFGVFLRAKKAENKTSTMSAFISAFIGITEPALYAVGFRFKKPLLGAIIGGAVSGAFVAASGAKAITFAMPAIISLPAYTGSIPTMLIGLAISFVVSAAVSYAVGLDESIEKDERAVKAEKKNIIKKTA